MQRLRFIVSSTVGKKEVMALTGLCLILFLVVHLGGNLNIYRGRAVFDHYAETLHSLGPLVRLMELGLFAIGVLHIVFALQLIARNLSTRPHGYAYKSAEGGRSWGSRTMIFTGPYILLFVVFHLLHFTLADRGGRSLSEIVAQRFHDPAWVAFYAFSMLVVGLHVSHGFWSAFQTLGLETARRGKLRYVSAALAWIFAVGFGLIPVVVYAAGERISF